jgi:hypothetical protein
MSFEPLPYDSRYSNDSIKYNFGDDNRYVLRFLTIEDNHESSEIDNLYPVAENNFNGR